MIPFQVTCSFSRGYQQNHPPTPTKIPRDSGHKHGQSKIWKLQPAVGVGELIDRPSPIRNHERNYVLHQFFLRKNTSWNLRTWWENGCFKEVFKEKTTWHFPYINCFFLHLMFVKERGGKLGSESKTFHKLNCSKIENKWWSYWLAFGGVGFDSNHGSAGGDKSFTFIHFDHPCRVAIVHDRSIKSSSSLERMRFFTEANGRGSASQHIVLRL